MRADAAAAPAGAVIIAVGSELLTPHKVDTNSLYLTEQLERVGVAVRRKLVTGDDAGEIGDALRRALGPGELIILTGGLGPTDDDRTRETVAEVLGLRWRRIRPSSPTFGRASRPAASRCPI